MEYRIDKREKYAIITIEEQKLSTSYSNRLNSDFLSLNTAGIACLILDLSNVKYIDSSGMSVILIANRLCELSSGLLILTGLQPFLAKTFSDNKLDTFLHTQPTVAHAIDHVEHHLSRHPGNPS